MSLPKPECLDWLPSKYHTTIASKVKQFGNDERKFTAYIGNRVDNYYNYDRTVNEAASAYEDFYNAYAGGDADDRRENFKAIHDYYMQPKSVRSVQGTGHLPATDPQRTFITCLDPNISFDDTEGLTRSQAGEFINELKAEKAS